MQKYWFKAKKYGWGWYPSAWQGWFLMIAILIAMLSVFFNIYNIMGSTIDTVVLYFYPNGLALIFLLILFASIFGERPRWRWGEEVGKEKISIEDFLKTDLRIARIKHAERVSGSEKLLRLEISLGKENRQILAGIGKAYNPENLINKEIVIVANLEPRKLMGLESNGMLLAAQGEKPILLVPEKETAEGSTIG